MTTPGTDWEEVFPEQEPEAEPQTEPPHATGRTNGADAGLNGSGAGGDEEEHAGHDGEEEAEAEGNDGVYDQTCEEFTQRAAAIAKADMRAVRQLLRDMAAAGVGMGDAEAVLAQLRRKDFGSQLGLKGMYREAVARERQARVDAGEAVEDESTPKAPDYLLNLVERAGYAPWLDKRTGRAVLKAGTALHLSLNGSEARDALINLWADNPLGGARVAPREAVDNVQAYLRASVTGRAAAAMASCVRYAPVFDDSGELRLTGVVTDNGDDDRNATLVTAEGVKVIDAGEVDAMEIRFLRRRTALPFPEPDMATGIREGMDALAELVSLSRSGVVTAYGALVASMMAGPVTLPVFPIIGAQGEGKTATGVALKNLLDPTVNKADSKPKSVDDFRITAAETRALVMDNLTDIKDDLSDAICTAATGGYSTRRGLYTDDEKFMVHTHATVFMTSIEDGILVKGDLMDRSVELELIRKSERRSDATQEKLMQKLLPKIRGSMLNALSGVMAHLDQEADIAGDRLTSVVQVLKALDAGSYGLFGFEQAYRETRSGSASRFILRSSFCRAVIIGVMGAWNGGKDFVWTGNSTSLATAMQSHYQGALSAEGVGMRMRSEVTAFAMAGVEVGFGRSAEERGITIRISARTAAKLLKEAKRAAVPFDEVS